MATPLQANGFLYDRFLIEALGSGLFSLASDVLKVGLLADTYSPDIASHSILADVSAHEIAGGGYSRQTVTGAAVSRDANQYIRFDCDSLLWTATGSGMAFKYWFMFDDTLFNDRLIAYGEVDELDQAAGNDGIITLLDTKEYQWIPNELGLFRFPSGTLGGA